MGYATTRIAWGLGSPRSSAEYSVTFLTVRIGLALLGATAFLAVAKTVFPSGAGLRVVNWRRAWLRKWGRTSRYTQIFAMNMRDGRIRWAARLGAVDLANGFATAIGEELDFRIETRNMAAVLRGRPRGRVVRVRSE
ncbi:MAG: hypothetical protein H7270_18320 [Dermatophilaceae bacterium]|nr:hypothetical protein [Dermatophilaceae bacterium]